MLTRGGRVKESPQPSRNVNALFVVSQAGKVLSRSGQPSLSGPMEGRPRSWFENPDRPGRPGLWGPLFDGLSIFVCVAFLLAFSTCGGLRAVPFQESQFTGCEKPVRRNSLGVGSDLLSSGSTRQTEWN